MGVIGERLHNIGPSVHELAMELGDQLRFVQHHLRDERPGLQVTPSLELEEVTLSTDHRPGVQPIDEPAHNVCHVRDVRGVAVLAHRFELGFTRCSHSVRSRHRSWIG